MSQEEENWRRMGSWCWKRGLEKGNRALLGAGDWRLGRTLFEKYLGFFGRVPFELSTGGFGYIIARRTDCITDGVSVSRAECLAKCGRSKHGSEVA